MGKIYYIGNIPVSDELYHSRTKGSKNGVRRYQNEDGSYTPLGRIHYGIGKAKNAVSGAVSGAAEAVQKGYRKGRYAAYKALKDYSVSSAEKRYNESKKNYGVSKWRSDANRKEVLDYRTNGKKNKGTTLYKLVTPNYQQQKDRSYDERMERKSKEFQEDINNAAKYRIQSQKDKETLEKYKNASLLSEAAKNAGSEALYNADRAIQNAKENISKVAGKSVTDISEWGKTSISKGNETASKIMSTVSGAAKSAGKAVSGAAKSAASSASKTASKAASSISSWGKTSVNKGKAVLSGIFGKKKKK